MKTLYLFVICILICSSCKDQASEKQIVKNHHPVALLSNDTSAMGHETPPPRTKKPVIYDTVLSFLSVERIFEDEFYLLFKNDSDQIMKFYYIPSFSNNINYHFITESEGYFISNLQLEGKRFNIMYSSNKQVNFMGEKEITNRIHTIFLLQSKDEDTPEEMVKRFDLRVEELKACINHINWDDAVRIDSASILYEEDFMYPHASRLYERFIGFNDCSGDSVFKTYFSDRTVQIGGTKPSIFWICDFTLPSLNLRVGDDKEDILAKLGTPSYNFDSILVYPKYLPDVAIKTEKEKVYDDTVYFIFRNNKLAAIIAFFYFIC